MSERSVTAAPCSLPIRISTSFASTALALFSGPQNLSSERPNTDATAAIRAEALKALSLSFGCSERHRGVSPMRCIVLLTNSSEPRI